MRSVVLVGFPGCGKTSVGKVLASSYGLNWKDADAELERQVGRSITSIIREDGEERFRQLETETLQSLLESDVQVISLGGGALTIEANRKLLTETELVFLKTSKEELVGRLLSDEQSWRGISGEAKRPLLNVNEDAEVTKQEIELRLSKLIESRAKVFENVKTQVSTEGKSIEQVAQEVAEIFNT